jgi:hypothetical protein
MQVNIKFGGHVRIMVILHLVRMVYYMTSIHGNEPCSVFADRKIARYQIAIPCDPLMKLAVVNIITVPRESNPSAVGET